MDVWPEMQKEKKSIVVGLYVLGQAHHSQSNKDSDQNLITSIWYIWFATPSNNVFDMSTSQDNPPFPPFILSKPIKKKQMPKK